MVPIVALLLLSAAFWIVVKVGAKIWTWCTPLGGWTVTASFLLVPAFLFYACLSMVGIGYSLSPEEAQADLANQLGVSVPPVVAVSSPKESWAIGDYYYGYTAEFEAEEFRDLIARWEADRDTSDWVMTTNPYVTDSLYEGWSYTNFNTPGGTTFIDVELFPSSNRVQFSYAQD